MTATVLTFLDKKSKKSGVRGIHFLQNAKKKNSKSNLILVIVFAFESEGLRLLALISKSAMNNDYEVPYSIYKKINAPV